MASLSDCSRSYRCPQIRINVEPHRLYWILFGRDTSANQRTFEHNDTCIILVRSLLRFMLG